MKADWALLELFCKGTNAAVMTSDEHYVNLVKFKGKGDIMFKSLKLFILTVFALFIMACTAPPKSESMGEYLDSSAVTAKVKARLVDDLGTHGFAIQVKTYKDEVQLSGFVDSAYIKKRAGTVAAHTMGVKQVRNNLIIK